MKTYLHPFPRNTVKSQGFGVRPGGWNPPGGHTGEDSAVPIGTPVHAAGDGVIEAARIFSSYNNPWLYGPQGGLTVVLDCGPTEPSFGYSHLSHVYVRVGQRVKRGDIIALSGNTGTATTGAHCHTEALPPNWNVFNGTYGRVNPRIYMTEFPGEITAQSTTKTPATKPIQKDDSKMLILVKGKDDAIWIGDGITRRQIPDVQTLHDLQYRHSTGELKIANLGQVIVGNVELAGKAI